MRSTHPQLMLAASAITHDSTRLTWCRELSTGMIVAESPIMLAIERSNSPTTKVHSPAIASSSRADCEPKIVCRVAV